MASTIRYYSNMKTFIRVIKRTSLFLEMIRAHCELFLLSMRLTKYINFKQSSLLAKCKIYLGKDF